MTKPRIIGMMLVAVAAVASIGLVTIGSQSTMAQPIFADIEEDVEAGNTTTTMMANQTGGNMTGGTNSTS